MGGASGAFSVSLLARPVSLLARFPTELVRLLARQQRLRLLAPTQSSPPNMARTKGAKDLQPRQRRAESDAVKARKQQQKEAAARAKQAFVQRMRKASAGAHGASAAASCSNDAAADDDDGGGVADGGGEHSGAESAFAGAESSWAVGDARCARTPRACHCQSARPLAHTRCGRSRCAQE